MLPVHDPDPEIPGGLSLVQRELAFGGRGPGARVRQLARVWGALREADAATYVFRSGIPALGIGGMFCRAHRRRLVFAASNDLDFTFDFYEGRRPELELYRFGARSAAAIVVQNGRQAALARKEFPGVTRIEEIPSFAERAEAASASPSAFLWVGRLDAYKQPARYIELAEALPDARFWMIIRRLDPARSGGSPGGDSDPTLERECIERASGLSNLSILEQRPHAEAMELVSRAVAVVNTGAAEGMPNLFLEAWARGVPVLSSEFDPDGRIAENGLGTAAGGSFGAFRAAARELWESRADRSGVFARTRAYVEATHGLDAVTARWRALISELGGGAAR